MATRGKGGKILFIRNLPYTTTNQQLEQVFSPYGTLRKCFVVKNKGDTGGEQCRGFGYVFYSTGEEALKAKTRVKVVSNRPVQIMYARRRDEKEEEEEEEKEDSKERDGAKGGAYDIGRTVIITSLSEDTTSKQLRVRCRKIGPVETLEYPVPGKEQRTASVTFKTHKDARQAVKTLQLKLLNGQFIQASLLSKDIKGLNKKSLKKSRLIVRNLSFKCTDEQLIELFNNHGSVISAQIVKNENNKSLGYGFVQFGSYVEAQQAMKSFNGITFQDRPIAVDWVVPREQYQAIKNQSIINEDESEINENQSDINEDESEINENQSDINDDQSDVNNDQSDDQQSDFDQSDDQCEEINSDHNEEEESIKQAPPTDVQEGKTLFVRNVPFDVDRNELFKLFQQFGSIKYCRPVLDPVTNKCKGSAFVQYKSLSSVSTCIEESKSEQGLLIGSDKLMVDIAISKEELAHMKKAAKQQELTSKDSRNLYLLEEGYIDPLSEVGQEMSKLDANKRLRSLQERRTKLKNPHYFISKTRLSVRNLPVSINEKSLKSLMIEQAGKHAIIKQIKLIRSKELFLPDGLGRPVGFGFVEFQDHNTALTVLRTLNNNPNVFGIDKRPIVEFALEDSRAIKLMTKRKIKQARSLKRDKEENEQEGKHFNKKVEWQLKWKERRLKKRSANIVSNSNNTGTNKFAVKPALVRKERVPIKKDTKSRVSVKTFVKGGKFGRERSNDKQKLKRQSVYDKTRQTNRGKPSDVSFNSKVSNYKKKLFNNLK